jgi:hypothetical protein
MTIKSVLTDFFIDAIAFCDQRRPSQRRAKISLTLAARRDFAEGPKRFSMVDRAGDAKTAERRRASGACRA